VNETKRPGGKPATINDIARLAEVSKKTVSRVINHSPFVKEETRRRVERGDWRSAARSWSA
jgi:LacI family transcriptional regulator